MSDGERATIDRRLPGFFKFQALLSLGLGLWMFIPVPNTRAGIVNSVEVAGTLWLLTAALFALFLDGRVSYTSEGLYIRSAGWRPLLGMAKEHFVRFDEIKKITPGYARWGGSSTADWLMFGLLQLHTKPRRPEEEELTLFQIFLNRHQLVRLLQGLADDRPDIIDQQVIDTLAGTA